MTRTSMRRGRTGQWGGAIAIVIAGAVLVFALFVVALAYTPVEPGTVVLIKRFGGLTGDVHTEGLHWRVPFADQRVVVPIAIRSYETSDDPNVSNADYRDIPVNAQTVDGQQITIKYTVLFLIPPEEAINVVRNIGTMESIVTNVVKRSRSVVRLWAQNYTAEDLYSGEGIFAYQEAVRSALEDEFSKYGVRLDDFLVRKIDFDSDYIAAIEQQQIAEEAIETAQYQADAAEYEKQRQIRLAEAEAERTKLQAAADAERQRLLADSEAYNIKARAEADAERQRLLADSEAYSIKARAEADAERQRLLADSEAYSIKARGEALQEFPELVQWEFVRNLESVQWGILPGEGITPLVPLPSFEGQEETSSLPLSTPTPSGGGE